MVWLNEVLHVTNSFLYANILIVLLIICGLYFTVKMRFVQFRLLPDAVRSLKKRANGKEVSSFQALMISTASRVGTGNIAGITTAIIAGGPGAVFWMWIMAFIGGASAFVESTLAQVYKVRDGEHFRGGPAYYIQKGLKSKFFGTIFAVIFVICFAYGFNPLQTYNISSSLEFYIPNYRQSIYPVILGLVLAIMTALVIYGGASRIGFITSYLVPIMALTYIALGVTITFTNLDKMPAMFELIFKNAFDFKAIFGGFAGSCMLIGIKKGLLSNEAGMGSAPNAAAAATVDHPVTQGMVQVVSALIDTLIICTTTAFIVLLCGVDLNIGLDGMPFVQAAISNAISPMAIHLITFSIFTFAFSSIIGNYYYAEANLLFIKDSKLFKNIFRFTCVVAVFFGALVGFDTVWDLAEVLMGLMALVNIVSILLLGGKCKIVLNDYMSQKRKGIKEPIFHAKDCKIENADVWE